MIVTPPWGSDGLSLLAMNLYDGGKTSRSQMSGRSHVSCARTISGSIVLEAYVWSMNHARTDPA